VKRLQRAKSVAEGFRGAVLRAPRAGSSPTPRRNPYPIAPTAATAVGFNALHLQARWEVLRSSSFMDSLDTWIKRLMCCGNSSSAVLLLHELPWGFYVWRGGGVRVPARL